MDILRLYIPVETSIQRWANDGIREYIVSRVGGYTTFQARGHWQGQREEVEVTEVWAMREVLHDIRQEAIALLTDAGEHSIGYTLNGQPVIRQLGEVG